jgi:hypothetical protein
MLTFLYNLNRAGNTTKNSREMRGMPRNIQREIQQIKTEPAKQSPPSISPGHP